MIPDARRAERDAGEAAEHAERDRLDQELPQHVAGARADRPADANLARPLGDRQQHDVHDADAADEQRHRRDGAEQRRHRPGRAVERAAELLEGHFFEAADVADDGARHVGPQAAPRERLPRLRRDGEIVRVLHADAMTLAQQRRHILRHARHLAGRRRGDRDVGQLGQVQQLVDRRERHVHRVELIVAGRRAPPSSCRWPRRRRPRTAASTTGPCRPTGVDVAEQLLRDERAEHDNPAHGATARAP